MKRHLHSAKQNILRATALIFAAVLAVSAAGCGSDTVSVDSDVMIVTGAMTDSYPEVTDTSIHLIDTENLGNPMASSGLMELYLDDNSLAVALFETSKKNFWYSLPTQSNANYDNSAAVLTADISCGNTMYHLNSQDNSVAFKNVACDVQGDIQQLTGFDMRYVMTVNSEVAEKADKDKLADGLLTEADFSPEDIVFEITVSYELRDGNLYVGAVWKNLSGNKNAVLERLELLPFFGASDSGEKGDFILVPDGSGAAINTAVADPDFEPLSFKVYGDGSDGYPATFPAFGAKQGSNAFAIIIESGDSIAHINADRSTGETGFNTVGASFDIAETKTVEEDGQSIRYINRTCYTDDITLCVRLLGGGNASYDGIAAACREQFMRSGVMSTSTVKNEEYLPFNLTLIGASTGSSSLIKRLKSVKALTTFEQAQDLLSRMKAKGINNINVRYVGAFSGGINQNEIGTILLSGKLGGSKDFARLSEYTYAQGIKLFLDVNILTWNAEKVAASDNAEDISGNDSVMTTANTVSRAFGDESYSRRIRKISLLENTVIGLLEDSKKINFDGFCVNDAGKLLYSDYSSGYTDMHNAADTIKENVESLSTNRVLMIDTGNFYLIDKADIITNLSLSPLAGERRGYYDSVPFVQMILHGTVDYSGAPINLADDKTSLMLRSVEYGACPSFEWCFESEYGTEDIFYYDKQLNDAFSFYSKANEALADLRDTRIVNNYETEADGVYCTEYENGAVIYVNYNETPSEINGITVSAQSFIRLG